MPLSLKQNRALICLAVIFILLGVSVMTSRIEAQNPARVSGLSVVVPIFNDQGLNIVMKDLKPYIRPGDVFALVSGNSGNKLDVAWLNKSAAALKKDFPDNSVIAMTAGLTNITKVAQGVTPPIEAVAYVYEPNFPNEPEFSWDFSKTLTNFKEAAQTVHSHGLRFIGKPTGRPLLQTSLLKYDWDYGVLGKLTDGMVVQTQTYCKNANDDFQRAIDKLISQYQKTGANSSFTPQITIAQNQTNGVTPTKGYECAEAVESRGVAGISMWWETRSPNYAAEFLGMLGRTPTPTPLPITKLGDLPLKGESKGDGKIDLTDVSILFSHWNSTLPEDLLLYDINPGPDNISQGKIDLYDANLLMKNWTGG